MSTTFEKSDKSLITISIINKVLLILSIIATVVVGIILWATSFKTVKNGWYNTTVTNNGQLITGILLVFLGWLPCLISYKIWVFILYIAFDIKIIRNRVSQVEDSSLLINFNEKKNKQNQVTKTEEKEAIVIGKCDCCGEEKEITTYKIEDSYGTRYRNLCKSCYEKHQTTNK